MAHPERQAWAEAAWDLLQHHPARFIADGQSFGRVNMRSLCDAVDPHAYSHKFSVMDRLMHIAAQTKKQTGQWIERQQSQYIFRDDHAEQIVAAQKKAADQQQRLNLQHWVRNAWQSFAQSHPKVLRGMTVTTAQKHYTQWLTAHADTCPDLRVAQKLTTHAGPQAIAFVRRSFWSALDLPIQALPGLTPFLLDPTHPDAETILRKKRQSSLRAFNRQRAAYYRRHGTTEEAAHAVWHSLGLSDPMPRGFWNEGAVAWWSSFGLRQTPDVTLLSHLKLHAAYGANPIGWAVTPYGLSRVYRTTEVLAAREAFQTQRAAFAVPRLLHHPTTEELVACLVLLNRHARRLQRLVPTLYQARAWGLVRYYKAQKIQAYALKNAVLLRLAPLAQIAWHQLPAGWHAALTLSGPDHPYTFHLPAVPSDPPQNPPVFSEPFPVRKSPRWILRHAPLRLKDAMATLDAWVADHSIPDASADLVEAHQRSEVRHRAAKQARQPIRYFDETCDDEDEDPWDALSDEEDTDDEW